MAPIILGLNPEQYHTDWTTAVQVVQSLQHNVAWALSGVNAFGGYSVDFCWNAASKIITLPRPAQIDYVISGMPPLGLAAAVSLWTGASFPWNGTNSQAGMDADELALASFYKTPRHQP